MAIYLWCLMLAWWCGFSLSLSLSFWFLSKNKITQKSDQPNSNSAFFLY
jgi:hypothetical protein